MVHAANSGPEQAVSEWSGNYAKKMTTQLNVNKLISAVWLEPGHPMDEFTGKKLRFPLNVSIKSNKKCLL